MEEYNEGDVLIGGTIGRITAPKWYSPLTLGLIIARLLHALGLFVAYEILKIAPLLQFLFVVKLCCALIYVILQKPLSSGRPIDRIEWYKIGLHAVILLALECLYFTGMRLCGPLRTILVYENSDLVVATVLSALFSFSFKAKKFGVYIFLLAIASLLFFDNDDAIRNNIERPAEYHSTPLHYLLQSFSWVGLSDHKGGIILLFLVLCISVAHNSVLRKSSVEIGGAKRMNALVTTVEAVILAFPALIQYLLNSASSNWLKIYLGYIFNIIIVVYIISFYSKAIITARSSAQFVAFISTLASFVSALIVSYIWMSSDLMSAALPEHPSQKLTQDHALSGGVIFSILCFLVATKTLLKPQTLQQRGTKGQLIGFSENGLPLYSVGAISNFNKQSFFNSMKGNIYQILGQSHTRRIFFYLCLNLAFTLVELLYGVFTNSLGLISDGCHMLFDSTALVIGLCAALIAKWKPTKSFSFGFARVEILSGFLNAIFLIVIAIFVFLEAVHRLVDTPEIRSERLVLVSVLGLLVNLIGIVSLRHSHYQAHGHSHDANMQGIFLHVVADTLGSVGVIISSILIDTFGWHIADPICSVLISILIFLSALPLLKQSSSILLLRVPFDFEKKLADLLNKVMSVSGVVSYRDPHFWLHSSNIIAGTLHVRVKLTANEQNIVSRIHAIFKEIGIKYLTVQIEKDIYFKQISTMYSGIGNTSRQ